MNLKITPKLIVVIFVISFIIFPNQNNAKAEIFKNTLKYGFYGEEIKILQEELSKIDGVYPEKLITGYFGPLTEKAIKNFQVLFNIVKSGDPETTGYGIFGPKTAEVLNQYIETGLGENKNNNIYELRVEKASDKSSDFFDLKDTYLEFLLNEDFLKIGQQDTLSIEVLLKTPYLTKEYTPVIYKNNSYGFGFRNYGQISSLYKETKISTLENYIQRNKWQNVKIVYEPRMVKFYLDNEKIMEYEIKTPISNSSEENIIVGDKFNGYIGSIKISKNGTNLVDIKPGDVQKSSPEEEGGFLIINIIDKNNGESREFYTQVNLEANSEPSNDLGKKIEKIPETEALPDSEVYENIGFIPSPNLVFTATKGSIDWSGDTTLLWRAENADRCLASGGWSGERPTQGEEVLINLKKTSVYSLNCVGPGGNAGERLEIFVDKEPISLPSGKQEYSVTGPKDSKVKFLNVSIDPLNVAVGDTQTLQIKVFSELPISSVVATTKLDTEFLSLPLDYISSDSSGEIWQASWTVFDTHVKEYTTTFSAVDSAENRNEVSMNWVDPCSGIVHNSDSSLNDNCTVSSISGIDNGSLIIPTGKTLTLNNGAIFAWNPGTSITIEGSIVIAKGGSLKKGYLYYPDNDEDEYPDSKLAPVFHTESAYSGHTRIATSDSKEVDVDPNSSSCWRYRYTDSDGDGYGAGSLVCVGDSAGYVDNNTDCASSDATRWRNLSCYADTDGDDYTTSGSTALLCTGSSCSSPNTSYKDSSSGVDCNDSNFSTYTTRSCYVDSDNDGYTTGGAVSVCKGSSCTSPSGHSTSASSPSDANDSNASCYRNRYADTDGDGYGAGSLVCVANQAGYVDNASDCSSSDSSRWQNLSCYYDADGDGYATGGASSVCTGSACNSPSASYKTTSSGVDCNDSNFSTYTTRSCYVDSDNDGYTTGGAVSVCKGSSCTSPSGHSTSASSPSDANDSNASCYRNRYADTDGDGYGAGSLVCVANQAGYVDNASDCSSSDSSRWQNLSCYYDADGDGYTSSGPSSLCTGSACNSPNGNYRSNSSGSDIDDSVYSPSNNKQRLYARWWNGVVTNAVCTRGNDCLAGPGCSPDDVDCGWCYFIGPTNQYRAIYDDSCDGGGNAERGAVVGSGTSRAEQCGYYTDCWK